MIDTYYTEHAGSSEKELIKSASHSHPLFNRYNANIYYRLKEATRTMVHSTSIKPFQRNKDERNS